MKNVKNNARLTESGSAASTEYLGPTLQNVVL